MNSSRAMLESRNPLVGVGLDAGPALFVYDLADRAPGPRLASKPKPRLASKPERDRSSRASMTGSDPSSASPSERRVEPFRWPPRAQRAIRGPRTESSHGPEVSLYRPTTAIPGIRSSCSACGANATSAPRIMSSSTCTRGCRTRRATGSCRWRLARANGLSSKRTGSYSAIWNVWSRRSGCRARCTVSVRESALKVIVFP